MDAARVLTEWRRRAGLSQRALAERAGIAQPHIARIERGHDRPRVDTLDRLLAACGAELVADPVPAPAPGHLDRIRALLVLPPAERIRRHRARGLRVDQMLRILSAALVEYVVVGDLAALLHGLPVAVQEVEVMLGPGRENRLHAARAVATLGGGAFDELRKRVPRVVATRHGALRIGPPSDRYAAVAAAAWETDVGRTTITGKGTRVATIDDLIALADTEGDVERRDALRILRRTIQRG